jgi:glycosyltransferase involved in cell wall biosynthesis
LKFDETTTMKKKPIKVLAFVPGWIPSVVIGVLKPLVALEKRGEVTLKLRISSTPVLAQNAIKWCDVAVFSRNCEMSDLKWLYKLKALGKRVIYDVDDNFEEIPLNTSVGLYHRSFHRLHTLRRFFALADLTQVYSNRMLQRAEAHGADIRLVRCYFDSSIIKKQPLPRTGGTLKIAYPTGRIDDPRLEQMFFDALRVCLLRHPGEVELHLWRKTCPPQLRGIGGVVLNPLVSNYESFVKAFYAKGFDIGLAPLLDEPFFRSKTNNKYREYGGCGIAGIYSDMPPYSDSIVDGKTGLLVANTVEAWSDAIAKLIVDAALRNEIAHSARQDVATNYPFEKAVESFRTALREATGKPAKPCDWQYDDKLVLWASFVDSTSPTATDAVDAQMSRVNCFVDAVNALKGRAFPKTNARLMLSTPFIAKRSNVVLFIINSLSDLESAAISFPLCNSIILDISQLDADAEAFRTAYEAINVQVPATLLIPTGQPYILAVAEALSIPYLLATPKLRPIDNDFTLNGYSAVYLDGVERHIRYGSLSKQSRLRKAMAAVRRRLSSNFELYSGRVRRAWLLLSWMMGMRPL